MKRSNSFLGKYQYTNSIIHKIDSRVKVFLTFFLIVFVFFLNSFYSYFAFLLLSIFLILLIKVKPQNVFSSLRPIVFLMLFSVFFQLFFAQGEPVFVWYFIKITKEGLYLALYIALRLILLSVYTFILTSTTSTLELAEAFKKIISPLKVIKFPADEIALMISISLQFVPILFEEADRIMKAQTSRGVEFNEGGLIRRAKSFLPIILPLLLNAFNRADQLALAMESRGFVIGSKRESYYEKPFAKRDYLSLIFILLFSFFVLLMDIKKWKII